MLKYTGNGFIIGIPARDLTDEEVIQFGGEDFLVKTGLYSKPQIQPDHKEPVKEQHGNFSKI